MYTKIVLVFVFATVATVLSQGHHEHHGHVGYQFEYGVQDPHTHDVHSQKQHRDGDNVVGEYALLEADGTHRVVKYKAGPHTGFEAIVERHGHAQHPAHYGKHKGDGPGGVSFVGTSHWSNQGHEEYHGHH